MRIDRLLCCLRLAKSRAIAGRIVLAGHVRCNGQRVTRTSHPIGTGDVLTVPIGRTVRVLEITALPERRGSATEAQACYRALDPAAPTALAAQQTPRPPDGAQAKTSKRTTPQ